MTHSVRSEGRLSIESSPLAFERSKGTEVLAERASKSHNKGFTCHAASKPRVVASNKHGSCPRKSAQGVGGSGEGIEAKTKEVSFGTTTKACSLG